MSKLVVDGSNDNTIKTTTEIKSELNLQLDDSIDESKLESIYFEPRFCSDVKVIYQGVCLHLHRYVLCKQSVYFQTLLESTKEVVIQLSEFKLNPNYTVSSQSFIDFCQCLYSSKQLEESNFINMYQDRNKFQGKDVINDFIYLAHYFQSDQIEIQLQEIIKVNQTRDLTNPRNFFTLENAIRFNWNNVKEFTIDNIAKNLLQIRQHRDYKEQLWTSIDPKIREAILEKALVGKVWKPKV